MALYIKFEYQKHLQVTRKALCFGQIFYRNNLNILYWNKNKSKVIIDIGYVL